MLQGQVVYISIGMFSTVLLSIALFLVIQLYVHERYRFALYIIPMTFFPLLWIVLSQFSIILFIPDLEIIAIAMIIPTGFFFVAFFDSLTRDSIDLRKASYLVSISSVFILSSILEIVGDELNILTSDGMDALFFIRYVSWNLYAAPLGILWIFYMYRIYRKSPSNLRRYASISLLGSILVGFINPLLVISQFGYAQGFHMLVFAVGVFLSFLCWVLEPQLAYILPFKALRLMVVDTVNGLPLFSHIWNREEESEEIELMTTVIQAITVVIDETLRKGIISHIALERAEILVKRLADSNVACLLISTRSSQALRYALEAFSNAFYWSYSDHFGESIEINNYSSAADLIRLHFSFVPVYS